LLFLHLKPSAFRIAAASLIQGASRTNFFDRKQTTDIYRFIGYEFGFIHDGIMTPERTLRPAVTTIIAFDDNQDAVTWHDHEDVWFFTAGCLLGELSGHLFPLTDQERQQWKAEAEAIMKEYDAAHQLDQESQTQDTEPLTPVPVLVVEYTA
jgi:hypothetical protein